MTRERTKQRQQQLKFAASYRMIPAALFTSLIRFTPASAAFLTNSVHSNQVIIGSSSRSSRSSVVLRSTSFITPPPPPEEDLSKWDKMYETGEKSQFGTSKDIDPKTLSRSEVKVVTFDLDNTLWKTSKVINAANDALFEYLEECDLNQPRRVEMVMGELFQATPSLYSPPQDESGNKQKKRNPTKLTQLRIDAVIDVCIKDNEYTTPNAKTFANEAFEVWTKARHDAIPDHYAESVIKSLERIRELRTTDGHGVIIGAITDGNSDPRNVPALKKFFDFCVNAERVGVSKPNRRVYTTAVEEVMTNFPKIMNSGDEQEPWTEDRIDGIMGPWWVHVGDDFLKDIVAAKDLKMRTIWSKELVKSTPSTDEKNEPKKPQRDLAEFMKEVSSMKTVTMTIGADDFLMESMHQEFADVIVDRFEDVSTIISEWHLDALAVSASLSSDGKEVVNDNSDNAVGTTTNKTGFDKSIPPPAAANNEGIDQSVADMFEVIVPDDPQPSVSSPEAPAATADPVVNNASNKFCVFCGTKIPRVANFCTSCGQKQPQI